MSLQFTYDGANSSLNITGVTFAWAIYYLKTLLKYCGWTVPQSSDGSTYNNSGDQITTGNSGANGMDNALAWFVIQQPSSSRSFCFQRQNTTGANTSYMWRIKYSRSAGFSGGSPSATLVPTATDEQFVIGTGTGTTGFISLCGVTTDGGFRFNCCADNASPYGFISWGWQNTTTYPCHAFGLDPITSYCSAEPDPYIIHCNGSLAGSVTGSNGNPWNIQTAILASSTRQLMGFYSTYSGGVVTTWCGQNTGASATTQIMMGAIPSFYGGYPNITPASGIQAWLGTNADNKDDVLPMFAIGSATGYTSSSGTIFRKGYSTLTRIVGQPSRSNGSRMTIGSTYDGVVVAHFVLPWDGSSSVTL